MSSHPGQLLVLQCGLQSSDLVLRPRTAVSCASSSSSGASTSGLGLRNGRVRCSGREPAREEEESRQKKWVAAALAAMVMVTSGAAAEPAVAFDWFGKPQMEKDPVEPFTIYGSIL